jgi:GNAT superfamily N-acetyltransferase
MSSRYTIRNLEPSDAEPWAVTRWEALTRHPLAFGATPPETLPQLADSVRARLASPEQSVIFGAFDGFELVGIVGVVRETGKKERHKSRIWGMYVTESHRRSGLGALLLNAAIQQARSWEGVRLVTLSVTDAADGARNLYERHGFQAWGREPRAIYAEGRYADETHMTLDLDRQISI